MVQLHFSGVVVAVDTVPTMTYSICPQGTHDDFPLPHFTGFKTRFHISREILPLIISTFSFFLFLNHGLFRWENSSVGISSEFRSCNLWVLPSSAWFSFSTPPIPWLLWLDCRCTERTVIRERMLWRWLGIPYMIRFGAVVFEKTPLRSWNHLLSIAIKKGKPKQCLLILVFLIPAFTFRLWSQPAKGSICGITIGRFSTPSQPYSRYKMRRSFSNLQYFISLLVFCNAFCLSCKSRLMVKVFSIVKAIWNRIKLNPCNTRSLD